MNATINNSWQTIVNQLGFEYYIPAEKPVTKSCPSCDRKLPLDKFMVYKTKRGQSTCKLCIDCTEKTHKENKTKREAGNG